MTVGRNIAWLRLHRTKYSQKEIADLLEIDRNTYASWENGITDVKSSFIPKLAAIFNVSITQLFHAELSKKNCDLNEECTSPLIVVLNSNDQLSEKIRLFVQNNSLANTISS